MTSDAGIVEEVEIRRTATRREVIRVSVERGEVKIREWFAKGDGELRPGRDGMKCRPDQIPDLIKALQEALEVAAETPSRRSRV